MPTCVTWRCGQPAIARLQVRRPCGHPVSLNSSGDRSHVVDGTPPVVTQEQWSCRACILRRAGTSAPGPSTCPTCGVREPVTVAPLMHAARTDFGQRLCHNDRPWGPGEQVACYVDANRALTTCPDCLDYLHS